MGRLPAGLGLLGMALASCGPAEPPARTVCCAIPPWSEAVYFPLGGTAINERGRKTIADAVTLANGRRSGSQVDVVGHADAMGGESGNPGLAAARARAVAAALEQAGLEQAGLEQAGLEQAGLARERITIRLGGGVAPERGIGPGPESRRVDIIVP